MAYDSTRDTTEHIARVRTHLEIVRNELKQRALLHDWTKLHEPEKPLFDAATSLRTIEYGTPAYEAAKATLGAALDHHYKTHRHHPEFHKNGINDMNLVDIIEMLCDWKAATERMKDGDLRKSLEINKERFGISDQLYNIMVQTAKDLKFI